METKYSVFQDQKQYGAESAKYANSSAELQKKRIGE